MPSTDWQIRTIEAWVAQCTNSRTALYPGIPVGWSGLARPRSSVLFLHGSQRQQRRALGVGDACQAADLQALVATLGPQGAQTPSAAGLPQPHRPVNAAAHNQLPVCAERHTKDPAGVALQRRQ